MRVPRGPDPNAKDEYCNEYEFTHPQLCFSVAMRTKVAIGVKRRSCKVIQSKYKRERTLLNFVQFGRRREREEVQGGGPGPRPGPPKGVPFQRDLTKPVQKGYKLAPPPPIEHVTTTHLLLGKHGKETRRRKRGGRNAPAHRPSPAFRGVLQSPLTSVETGPTKSKGRTEPWPAQSKGGGDTSPQDHCLASGGHSSPPSPPASQSPHRSPRTTA